MLSRIATREIALVEKPGSTCSLGAHEAKLRVKGSKLRNWCALGKGSHPHFSTGNPSRRPVSKSSLGLSSQENGIWGNRHRGKHRVRGSVYSQKIFCKASYNHALRVETLSMQNRTEDTSSLDSPITAPDLCGQMHPGEQPDICYFSRSSPKKSPSPLLLGSHVSSLQPVSLRNTRSSKPPAQPPASSSTPRAERAQTEATFIRLVDTASFRWVAGCG